MLLCLLILSILFLYYSNNVLLSLLILEMLSFILLYFVSINMSVFFISDFFVILLFSIFVIEGVMGLSGLILLVSFSGSDYVNSSSIVNC